LHRRAHRLCHRRLQRLPLLAGNQAGSTGDKFIAALTLADQNKSDEALAALSAIEKDGHGSYPLLAKIGAATLQAQKACYRRVAAFTEISKQSGVPSVIRDAPGARSIPAGRYGNLRQISAQVEELAVPANGFRIRPVKFSVLPLSRRAISSRLVSGIRPSSTTSNRRATLANRAQMMLDNIIASGKAPRGQG